MIDAHGDADAAVARNHLRRLVDGLRTAGINPGGGRMFARAAAAAVDDSAGLAQHARDAPAGAARGPRHESHFPFESLHRHSLLSHNGTAPTTATACRFYKLSFIN